MIIRTNISTVPLHVRLRCTPPDLRKRLEETGKRCKREAASRDFQQNLAAKGFVKRDGGEFYGNRLGKDVFHRVVDGVEQFVCVDYEKNHVYLGYECVPDRNPPDVRSARSIETTGWSPPPADGALERYISHFVLDRPGCGPYHYSTRRKMEGSEYQGYWEFLATIGLEWLSDPHKLRPDQWKELHGISIRRPELIQPKVQAAERTSRIRGFAQWTGKIWTRIKAGGHRILVARQRQEEERKPQEKEYCASVEAEIAALRKDPKEMARLELLAEMIETRRRGNKG